MIQPGQYLCVFADRDGNDDMVDPARAPSTNLIAEFNLSAAGGYSVVLSRADGEIVDRMALPQQYRDISYGRKNDSAECVYFDQMTPGAANAGNTYLGRAETPVFSVSGGLFEAGDTIEVELSAPSDCRVYYTTDRTDPTENSNRYTSPIRISSQTVLRVRAYKDGCMPSYMDTQSYLFEVKNGGGSVYTVSIVSDPYNLTSDEAGILVKGSGSKPNYDQDWEREAHVEIYDPNGNLVVSQECGMRQQGQTCRSEPQQCFKLIARKEYGDDLFRGHIFTNRDYDVCRAILIRNSSDDANKTRMRDSVLQKLAEGTSVLYQETEVCVVYLNGEYWGHYNIREAVNPTLICLNEGWVGDENELDYVLKNNTLLQGSDDSFQNLLAYLTTNDPNTGAAYQMIDENIDIQNYIEYMSIQIFCGNTDPSNVKRYRNPNADGKWRWVLYDIFAGYEFDRALACARRRGKRAQNGQYVLYCLHEKRYVPRSLPRILRHAACDHDDDGARADHVPGALSAAFDDFSGAFRALAVAREQISGCAARADFLRAEPPDAHFAVPEVFKGSGFESGADGALFRRRDDRGGAHL